MDFETLSILAIQLVESRQLGTFSKIGGHPDLHSSIEWPIWKDSPLTFVCQLALAEFQPPPSLHSMPRTGYLYFFYDQEQETWGFSPEDQGSWKVIYTQLTPDIENREPPEGLDEEDLFAEKKVQFRRISSLPDPQRVKTLDAEGEDFWEQYVETKNLSFSDMPHHQLGGFPDVIQSDEMELECQLVSNGLYCGDGTGYSDPRAKELESGAKDWKLLLQIDSDDDLGMMWGDCGMLYFWIKEEDLKEGRFENVWMILQCS